MTAGSAWIERVKFSIHDSVKCHRASPRANHRRENQPKSLPARPAAIVPRRHKHRRKRERQRENRVREAHKRTPFLNRGKHLLTQRRKGAKAQSDFCFFSASLRLCVFALNSHSFSSAQRGASLFGTPMWSRTRATTV